jgi:hypothetical protein
MSGLFRMMRNLHARYRPGDGSKVGTIKNEDEG